MQTIRLTRRPQSGRWLLLGMAWIVLLLIAVGGDRSVAKWVHAMGIDAVVRGRWFAQMLKFPGTFWFILLVAIVGFWAGKLRPLQALFIVLAGVMSGIDWFFKWIVGRTRPFRLADGDQPDPFRLQPFWHGLHGLFHEKNLSFPSGHACTAFALATAVALVRPSWLWMFLILATVVGVERVFENAHYMSDVVAAAGVGAGGTLLVHWLMKRGVDDQPKVP